jgi:hypothetical protein
LVAIIVVGCAETNIPDDVMSVLAMITHKYVYGNAICVGMCCWPRGWLSILEYPDPVLVLRLAPPVPAMVAYLDSIVVFFGAGVREKRRTHRLMLQTLDMSAGRIRFPIGDLSVEQEQTMC